MKEKTKEFLKKYLIGFILGVVLAGAIIVYAETYFPSNDVTYDNRESGLSSTDVQGAIDELYGVCTVEPPAGEQIIEDAGLEKDPYECRYFFTGANPNNYVTFNDEQAGWRIISVECDGTIKIMRNDSIGNMVWDSSGSNNWAKPASLNTYLNEIYYNELNSTAKNQIVAHDFGIGAITFNNDNLFEQISDENNTKWNGKVALPTASEYIRTNSNKSNCLTFSKTHANFGQACRDTNWMIISSTSIGYWWLLSPDDSGNILSLTATSQGYFYSTYVNDSFGLLTRPALYLSSEVKITGGNGSQSSPYEIE